ncbi:MAG: 2-isopropylmalate synthase [Muribaculum sp.]|nr:2-isopropylmalate synthase [Muribaculaceae bacterium]MCM1081148.1 2-isopropylmalate synthase [Muribaculum sp.]
MHVEILDTTLRDGEQTSGVSFSTPEKMAISRLLLAELHVPRIEIASARVSEGERETVARICAWASKTGYSNALEVLGFLDNGKSVDWITSVGGRVINLLAKGSERHCRLQLGQTPEQHIEAIAAEIERARSAGLEVNLYLEDWSNGMKQSRPYVLALTQAVGKMPVRRVMLPDTLGILNPYDTLSYIHYMVKLFPSLHFDFHAHNDYDLATANVFAAVKGGARGIHCTVNGLGERAGNAALSSAIAVIHDQLHATTGVDESRINKVSHIVESFSGIRVPPNKPIIGDSVFTQCAGVHADGDNKNRLYYNDLLPERFDREREYALGKTSGRANIRKNLESLGIELSEAEIGKVTDRVIQLADKKELVTQSDLPFIIADVLKHSGLPRRVKLINYSLTLVNGLRPTAMVKLSVDGTDYQESAVGDGQFDAFMHAVRNIYQKYLHRPIATLTNYTVSIPPGGKTDALVHTVITWNYNGHTFKTGGLDADQTEAAIQATLKMLNLCDLPQ